MTPRNLLAVAIGAMAVWFISVGIIGLLAQAVGEFSYLIVGLTLLAVAGFVAPWEQPFK